MRIDGVGLRAGVPVHRRVDIEVEADWLVPAGGPTTDSPGLYYFLQARHVFTAPEGQRYAVFATYGSGGWVQCDPLFVALPIQPHLGAGVQFAVGTRVAIRVDAQAIFGLFGDLRPFTGRVSGGIAVPLGTASPSPVRRLRIESGRVAD